MSTLQVYKKHKIWCILRGKKKRVAALMFKNSLKQSLINLFPNVMLIHDVLISFCFCHLLQNYKNQIYQLSLWTEGCNGNFLRSNLNETFIDREILHTFQNFPVISLICILKLFLPYAYKYIQSIKDALTIISSICIYICITF